MSQQRPPEERTSGKIRIVETDYIPPCPHCREPLRTIHKNLSSGTVQFEAIYSCAACGQLLGIGYGRDH